METSAYVLYDAFSSRGLPEGPEAITAGRGRE